MADNVSVAVRIRPLNEHERSRGSKCCIKMDSDKPKVCHLICPSDPSLSKQFTFDHIFNSFIDDESLAASQHTVWEAIGRPIVEAAWDGYNSTIFAYGQTGSGKSHTMVGFDHTDKGIIPNACEEIFQLISGNNESDVSFRVECSMLEIYNERIRDLLVPFSKLKKDGLKLRESPSLGVVVEGLKSAPVSGYGQIEHLMAEGTKNRTIAVTNMNATSSRAHTIFMVKLTQIRVLVENQSGSSIKKNSERTSIINLVDLAGSERQKRSGAAGDRLKEAGAINRSLSALGNVISALASNSKQATSTSNKPQKHIPYRDSTLTFLLRSSLGGNARTTMLAACSPADSNFEETLSTLRYAERAKSILNRPVVNEGVEEKLVRELKSEVEELRKQLARAKEGGLSSEELSSTEALLEAERSAMREIMEREMEVRLKEYECMMTAMGFDANTLRTSFNGSQLLDSWEERQAETDAMIHELSIESMLKEPHFSNINEDPALSGVLSFPLKEGTTLMGSNSTGTSNMVVLGGLGIAKEHAKVVREDHSLALTALTGRTSVNGREVGYDKPVKLNNDDCVALGTSCILRVRIPSLDPPSGPKMIDWGTAVAQLNHDMLAAMHEEGEEREDQFTTERKQMMAKVEELEGQLALERTKREASHSDDASHHVSELEARLAAQIEKTKKLAARHEQEIIGRTVLDEQLLRMLPLVHEANAISGELGKGLRFAVKLISKTVEIGNNNERTDSSVVDVGANAGSLLVGVKGKLATEVAVLVHHDDDPSRDAVMWSAAKFNDRIYLMREVYQLWVEGGESFENNTAFQSSIFATPSGDPFYDPPEDTLVGVAYLQLEAVRWLLDITETTPLVDYRGQQQGEVSAELTPILSIIDSETEYEDLAEVPVHASLDLEVKLHSARELPRKFITPSRSCYISFRFPSKHLLDGDTVSRYNNQDGTLTMRTPRVPLTVHNPTVNHTQLLKLALSQELTEYLTTSAISFELWVSVDPPGNWSAADRAEEDELDEELGSEDSDDEGIAPHGIAMVRSQGGQRRREREWQLQRQDQGQPMVTPTPHLPQHSVSLEIHDTLLNEMKELKAENESLREQLEHAMHLIAASQTPPIPNTPNKPTSIPEVNSSPPSSSTLPFVITGKSARAQSSQRIEVAKNLDRAINGRLSAEGSSSD